MRQELKRSVCNNQGKSSTLHKKRELLAKSSIDNSRFKVSSYVGGIFVSDGWIIFSKSSISRRNPD